MKIRYGKYNVTIDGGVAEVELKNSSFKIDVSLMSRILEKSWHRHQVVYKPTNSVTVYAATSNENGKTVMLHRFVLELAGVEIPKGQVVDHINGVGTDCRLSNLRVVSRSSNVTHRFTKTLNKTGLSNITKIHNLYYVNFIKDKTRISISNGFKTLSDAKEARDRLGKEIYGEEYFQRVDDLSCTIKLGDLVSAKSEVLNAKGDR